MLGDYGARVSEGTVSVIDEACRVAGIIVLLLKSDHPLVDSLAIIPERQRLGLGRRLLAFAEIEAVRRGFTEIRLYAHQTMVEAQRLYAVIGHEEIGRGTESRICARVHAHATWRGLTCRSRFL